MNSERATKRIMQSGDSLVIGVTKEVKRLGLGRGDDVDVTLSPALDNELTFIGQAMDNAIASFDLRTDKRTGEIYATRANVESIYFAVSLCASPKLVVGKCNRAGWCSIDVFTMNNDPLTSWVFRYLDHD